MSWECLKNERKQYQIHPHNAAWVKQVHTQNPRVPILFVYITLVLLVSFILCQYFEPFTCCDDFSHLLAWEKLSFVLYFSLVLESSSLSSDDFRQFLAWRAGPRLHVGSGANGFPHFLAPPLSPTFFRPGFWWQAHKKKMDQPTDRSWNLLKSEKKNKVCGASFKSKRDCIFCNG